MQTPLSNATQKRLATLLCVLCLGWMVSCRSELATGSCAVARPLSVEVEVRDSISGEPAADGAIGTLVGPGVNDTLSHANSLTLFGGDQSGTFVVTIDRPGYRTWIASNVLVTKKSGLCGSIVVPAELSARLQPATP
jgi:hypothetical protein